MAELLNGGRDIMDFLQLKTHNARMESLFTNNIYFLEGSDMSFDPTPSDEEDINSSRFKIISSNLDLKKRLGEIAIITKGVKNNKTGRETILERVLEVLKLTLFNADKDVLGIIEGRILGLTEILAATAKEYEDTTIKDLEPQHLDEEANKFLSALRDIFDNMFEEILLQFKNLQLNEWKDKQFTHSQFRKKMNSFNINEILEATNDLTTEAKKYREILEEEEMEDEGENTAKEQVKLLQEQLKRQTIIINEQRQKLNDAHSNESEKKKKTAEHLRRVLQNLTDNQSDATSASIIQQLDIEDNTNPNDTTTEDITMRESKEDNEDEKTWLKGRLKRNKTTSISHSVSQLAHKMARMSTSDAITTESMIKMIHAGKYKNIYTKDHDTTIVGGDT